MVVNFYFQKRNCTVLKFNLNDSSFFEITVSLFNAPHLKISKLNKHRHKSHPGRSRHIRAHFGYSDITKHIQELFRHIQNPA